MNIYTIIFNHSMANSIKKGEIIQTRRPITNKNAQKFQVGDLLWVKEAYINDEGKKVSPIFMPKAKSELTIEITHIHTDFVQNMTQKDAEQEGLKTVDEFKKVWNKMYNDWDKNPQCYIIIFKPILMNIDKYLAQQPI